MNSRKSFHREVKMMIAEGFTCQRYGFNVGADKFSLLTIENGKTSIMRLSEWTLISQSQKSHSDRLLGTFIALSVVLTVLFHDSLLGFFGFLFGVICVVLTAKGNVWSYVFGYRSLCVHCISQRIIRRNGVEPFLLPALRDSRLHPLEAQYPKNRTIDHADHA